MKILFTGGGTGGHIFPIIAVAREIRKLRPKGAEFYYIGPSNGFEKILLELEGIKVKAILAGKIRRYWGIKSIFQNFVDILFKIPIGTLQAIIYIFFLNPSIIFSKGGYGSLPCAIAGWMLITPIFLHESDTVPGFANKFASRLAAEIFVSFPIKKVPYFPAHKMILVGNPIRKEIMEGSAEEAKILFRLSGAKPVILILGGSQGASRINNVVLNILPELLSNFEIIHQTGKKNFQEVKTESKVVINKELEKYYHPCPFLKEVDIKHAYRACDLIVSRAGAGSIFEIAACGKPSILIPLKESAQNHQVKNAYAFAENETSLVLEETNLTPHFFFGKIKNLLSNPAKLEKMKKGAKEFSKPRAARIIAEYILEALN